MLNKQNVTINFGQGLDTKTDPFQVPPGKFLALQNTIFDKGGLLQKRNGFEKLGSLPDSTYSYLTTFNGNLTAIGSSLAAYSSGQGSWVNKGALQPAQLSTLPLIRSNLNQSQCDGAVSANGYVCTVFTDTGGTVTPQYKYAVADAVTGQNIVAPTVITSGAGTVNGSPRVFLLGGYFIVVFNVSANLQYIAINTANPAATVAAAVTISAQYSPTSTVPFDGIVVDNFLYLSFNGSDGGGAVRVVSLSAQLVISTAVIYAGKVASLMSVCADITTPSNPIVYAAFYDVATGNGYILAVNKSLSPVLAATQWITGAPPPAVLNVTSVATAGVATIFYEVANAYSYDANIATNFIKKRTCTQAGTLGTAAVVVRSVGLASKAFMIGTTIYMLAAYDGKDSSPVVPALQPTYFLINSSGSVIAKLAYSNGGGYLTLGLPSVTVTDDMAQIAYLIKDLLIPVNKDNGAAQSAGVYSQTGINLASFTITTAALVSSEIGGNINISGGFLWGYDGYSPVESNFHLWPDSVKVTTSGAGGSIAADTYYYAATYEWSDNQGNVFRSAPSIPVVIVTAGATSTNTIKVPTLRLTYKTANPVKIVLYRYAVAQATFYQVTSLTAPTLNDTTVDSVSITDTLANASIIGNSILYTTGGVVENIGPPATSVITLFKSRLFLVDAEDKNLLWYSKQVIENTPVEMSDLFTIYVAPTTSAQGNTGPITALSALDDKLIIFKKDAIYYLIGNGPDNTGANNDFSEPVFITSTVGCANQNSIIFSPNGLMFQSDKGIWLLGRDLSTTYIGAPVESFNDSLVESAINIPGTNQVRFTLASGVTLMYDYFFGQWGTFNNVPAISSTLYQSLHTFINSSGEAYQESPGIYLDGSNPVLMSFTTSWLSMAGLQGFERAYFFYLLATYITPHKLTVQIAYDYNPPSQNTIITPDNFNLNYGGDQLWGSGNPYGGNSAIEQWQVFFNTQKCQAFQISIIESYDASMGGIAGAGFTMSGLDVVVGLKGNYPRLRAARSVG